MDKWIDALSDRLGRLVAIPFVAQAMLALADGKITPEELHALTDKARWIELVVLGLVMGVLKLRK